MSIPEISENKGACRDSRYTQLRYSDSAIRVIIEELRSPSTLVDSPAKRIPLYSKGALELRACVGSPAFGSNFHLN